MPPSSNADLFQELEHLKKSFGSDGALRIPDLLDQTANSTFADLATLIRFHELLLFLRAYPHSPAVFAKAEEILGRFPDFVDTLRKRGDDLSALEEPDVSGIAGADFSALFSFDTVRRLTQLFPSRLEIAWDWLEDSHSMGGVLARLLPLFQEDAAVEAHVPYRTWIDAAVPKGSSALEWLLARIDARDYEALRLVVEWNTKGTAATRTHFRLPVRQIFCHGDPLIQRRDVSIDNELNSSPLPVGLLSRTEGRAFLDTALTVSAVRYRELHGFAFGDPSKVWKAEAGRGIEIYLAGVPPEHRLPLRACHSGMMFKNGVPVGYFEGLSIFERMELGFNLYYTFRDGETAWIFARLLHLCDQLLGVRCFVIHPYQIGWENDEAIESGAFWFYRKLGFRPVRQAQAELMAKEEKKVAARQGYRTSAKTLRKLAESPLIFEADGQQSGRWDNFQVRNIGLAVQQAMAAKYAGDWTKFRTTAVRSLSKNLGACTEDSRLQSLQNLALPLSLIPDLARWSPSEKAALLRIIKAKDGTDERQYLKLMQAHTRLRESLLRLGSEGYHG